LASPELVCRDMRRKPFLELELAALDAHSRELGANGVAVLVLIVRRQDLKLPTDPETIADALGLTKNAVDSAIARLRRLGYVE
jgi:DNA-binding MarR family transcriptional regulator